ncbi:hypothetical protein PVK06_008378 [Gossypium arboreum]|uniref:SWIM-type domain-containing protein n=1 Tax=Gossypium arboreum TaxID=29729 RepID=A0ABR0QJU3_GOSAR|nr:hypothetical protein PVK06_008378 [Gossypium arboreum]
MTPARHFVSGSQNTEAPVFSSSMEYPTPARHSISGWDMHLKPVPTIPEDVEGGSDDEEDLRFKAYSPPTHMHNIDLPQDDALEFPDLLHRRHDRTSSSLDSGELEVGKEFSNKDSFLSALKQHSIMNGVNYKVVKSKSDKFEAKCAVQDGVSEDHPKMDLDMLATLILPTVKADPRTSVPVLIANIRSQLRYMPSYRKAWIAKQKALEKMHGGWDASYNEVWQWYQVLERYVSGGMFALNLISASYRIGAPEYYPQFSDREACGIAHTIGYEISKDRFHEMLAVLHLVNEEGADYLYNIPFEHWTQAYDDGLRYGHMTSNLAECINFVLKGTCHLPTTSVVRETYFRLVTLFLKRAASYKGQMQKGHVWCAKVLQEINKAKARTNTMHTVCHDRDNLWFRVTEFDRPHEGIIGRQYHVHLRNRTCDCGRFDVLRYPCAHVIAACQNLRLDPMSYVDERHVFPPAPDERKWSPVSLDPFKLLSDRELRRKPKGRPCSIRIRTNMDIQ